MILNMEGTGEQFFLTKLFLLCTGLETQHFCDLFRLFVLCVCEVGAGGK